MQGLFTFVGSRAYVFLGHLYRMWTYALTSFLELRNVYFYRRQIITQFYWIGAETLPLASRNSAHRPDTEDDWA